MTDHGRTRLAVLGSPISHSLSPRLHRAAYDALGLDWAYDAVDVRSESLSAYLSSLDSHWRGLSLTMPLKREVMPLLDASDELARLTGVANTVLLTPAGRVGFNTDVYGITQALRQHEVTSVSSVVILGGGATATSALLATHRLGATAAQVWVRDPARTAGIRKLATELGVALEIRALGAAKPPGDAPDVVISTLPNGANIGAGLAPELLRDFGFLRHSVLFDVAYDPWPTTLASVWLNERGSVVPGIDMLVHQAVMQVRIFVSGTTADPLPDEAIVVQAMRESIRS